MKIIEKYDVTTWVYRFTCKKCKSVCEADHKDVSYSHSGPDGIYPASESYRLICGACTDSHSLNATELPELIKREAKSRYDSARSGGSWRD